MSRQKERKDDPMSKQWNIPEHVLVWLETADLKTAITQLQTELSRREERVTQLPPDTPPLAIHPRTDRDIRRQVYECHLMMRVAVQPYVTMLGDLYAILPPQPVIVKKEDGL